MQQRQPGRAALAQVAEVLDVALRSLYGRIIQSHDGVARTGNKRQKTLQHLEMYLRVADNALFANLFAPGFKLRLDETADRSIVLQQWTDRRQNELHGDE